MSSIVLGRQFGDALGHRAFFRSASRAVVRKDFTSIPMSALARSGADPATVAAAFDAVRDLLRQDTPAGG
ncbi:hypothetical protein [Streptomyces tibetensis]|uniref:hypothetical protein n=1 Tax=Streptomyces tibetensis TaxID=2382123 RepID=UPI00340714B6